MRITKLSCAGLFGAALALFIGCASSKEKVDESLQNIPSFNRESGEITPEEEYYIGRAVAANIIDKYKIVDNPVLTAYLNKICRALTVFSEKPEIYNGYHVRILDSNEVNAFATSGGHIFITQGLLAAAASEDGLAAVIGHEISHIQLQHAKKQIEDMRVAQQLSDISSQASAALGLDQETEVFSNSVKDITDKLMTVGYGQTAELEADANALKLMADAGYSPSAMRDVLNVLKSQSSTSTSGFFDSDHPTPEMRLANVESKIGQYSVEDTKSYRTARYQASK